MCSEPRMMNDTYIYNIRALQREVSTQKCLLALEVSSKMLDNV